LFYIDNVIYYTNESIAVGAFKGELLNFDLEFTKVIDDGIDKFYRALHDEQLNFLPAQQLRTCAFNFTGWKKTVGAL